MSSTQLVFSFVKSQLLVIRTAGQLRVPSRGELERHSNSATLQIGELDGQPCWGHHWPHAILPSEHYALMGLRELAGQLPDAHWALAGRAFQLVEWERTHRFCGACGTATERHGAGEYAMVCPACNFSAYPRVTPAMIVLVRKGRELLLAHHARHEQPVYSCLAGFVEAGESLEDCVRREVREEVGIEVDAIRYFGSQSWPFPNALMVAFFAEYASGELKPQEAEIADARWFSPEALPRLPFPFSIARKLVERALADIAALG